MPSIEMLHSNHIDMFRDKMNINIDSFMTRFVSINHKRSQATVAKIWNL
jgi:hypothetical protein